MVSWYRRSLNWYTHIPFPFIKYHRARIKTNWITTNPIKRIQAATSWTEQSATSTTIPGPEQESMPLQVSSAFSKSFIQSIIDAPPCLLRRLSWPEPFRCWMDIIVLVLAVLTQRQAITIPESGILLPDLNFRPFLGPWEQEQISQKNKSSVFNALCGTWLATWLLAMHTMRQTHIYASSVADSSYQSIDACYSWPQLSRRPRRTPNPKVPHLCPDESLGRIHTHSTRKEMYQINLRHRCLQHPNIIQACEVMHQNRSMPLPRPDTGV